MDDSEFEIEDGVPLPQTELKYPFAKLLVGQSFVVPLGGDRADTVRSRVSIAARKYSNRNHGGTWDFTCRTEERGVRLWRKA